MTAKTLLEQSLAKVESESIRKWATSEHNRPIFDQLAALAIKNGKQDTDYFASYIVCAAMG